MKLTRELIEAQAREAARVAEENNVYVDMESYLNGGLWVFDKMKEELRDKFDKGLCIGFILGSFLALILTQFIYDK